MKPIIVTSACLEFSACRYNGARLESAFVRKLRKFTRMIPICPEEEIGLGTPREPVRILVSGKKTLLHQPATAKDLTSKMNRFSSRFLNDLDETDGFILKSRSPSCGIRDTKQFSTLKTKTALSRGSGLFAKAVLDKFPTLAIEDESRLLNHSVRERFLTRVFTNARFREARKRPSSKTLERFNSQNKLLLQTYNKKLQRKLDKIISENNTRSTEHAFAKYHAVLLDALSRTPKYTSHITTLEFGFDLLADRLDAKERKLFRRTLNRYSDKQIPLSNVLLLLRNWIVEFGITELANQTYFEPYPQELNQSSI